MPAALTIEDLRRAARRKVPRPFYDHVDAGSWEEATFRRNIADLAQVQFNPRVLVDVSERDLSTTVLGQRSALPFGLGPVGSMGFYHHTAEKAAARAAQRAGIPMCLSTMSGFPMEEVAAESQRPLWFQLYFVRDRSFVKDLVERARSIGCTTLFVTVDLPVRAAQHINARNGLVLPFRPQWRHWREYVFRPAWTLHALRGGVRLYGNLQGRIEGAGDTESLMKWAYSQFDPSVTWKDMAWLRQMWPGPLVIKGVLNPHDARLARDLGADGIVVSNHGGRQLDGAPSTISVLPRIRDAVDEIEILFDGGIRSGQDVAKALSLGADFCLLGRAYVFGLGAGGEAGVDAAVDIIRNELSATMALVGARTIDDLARQSVIVGPGVQPTP